MVWLHGFRSENTGLNCVAPSACESMKAELGGKSAPPVFLKFSL